MSVQVTIPVRNLKCENGKIDENMYKTLKAEKNAVITYTLSGYDILAGSASPNGFTARTNGTLTVAGQKHGVDMKGCARGACVGLAVGDIDP